VGKLLRGVNADDLKSSLFEFCAQAAKSPNDKQTVRAALLNVFFLRTIELAFKIIPNRNKELF
jgi:hypothetical protein